MSAVSDNPVRLANSCIHYAFVDYGSFEYFEAVKLRDDVLRKPLGLSLSAEDLEKEAAHMFLVALKDEEVVGCLILTPPIDGQSQMRQVAVSPEAQGMGIGRGMVDAAEAEAKTLGLNRIFLHARKNAVPFYEKLGYLIEGPEFIEVGVPHRHMWKSFTS